MFAHQIALRVFLLAGTSLYLIYYFVAADDPLWPAIFGTGCIGVTSVYGLLRAIAYRSTLTISKLHFPIFEKMNGMEPGAFRKLMKTAEIVTFEDQTPLTQIGVIPDHVYFIIDGELDVNKSNIDFTMEPNSFVGEISIIGEFAATATVFSRAGSKAVVWNRYRLIEIMDKDDRFRISVEALFSKDMARKLAQAAKVQ
jgi:hypothetical protein